MIIRLFHTENGNIVFQIPIPSYNKSNKEADYEKRMEKDPVPAALPGAAGGTVPRLSLIHI